MRGNPRLLLASILATVVPVAACGRLAPVGPAPSTDGARPDVFTIAAEQTYAVVNALTTRMHEIIRSA